MSDAQVENLLKRYYAEVWLDGTITALDSLLADDYMDHDPLPGFVAAKRSAKAMAATLDEHGRSQSAAPAWARLLSAARCLTARRTGRASSRGASDLAASQRGAPAA